MLTNEEKALMFFELRNAKLDLAEELEDGFIDKDRAEHWDGVILSLAEKLEIDLDLAPEQVYFAMVAEQEGE